MSKRFTYSGGSSSTYGSIIFDGVASPNGSKIVSDNKWLLPTNNYTFSIWIKFIQPSPTTGSYLILGYRAGTTSRWEITRIVNNQIQLNIRIGASTVLNTAINAITSNQWHNLVVTKSSGNVFKIYIDSILAATSGVTTNGEPTVNVMGMAIGATVNNSNVQTVGSSFDGNMCHASFWNKELVLSEVQELYNGGSLSDLNNHSCSANLLSWQKMDFSETSFPTVINDASGNGNTWTSSNLVLADLVNDYPI